MVVGDGDVEVVGRGGGSMSNNMDPARLASCGRPLRPTGEAAGEVRVPRRGAITEFDLSRLGYSFPSVDMPGNPSGSFYV